MFRVLRNILSVLLTMVRFPLIKLIRLKGFYFYPVERFSPHTKINIWRGGTIRLGQRISAHSGVTLSATPGALLEIGDRVAINYDVSIVSRSHISIGARTTIGPRVMMFDHDHDFRRGGDMNGKYFRTGDILIGENCWIGAGTIILRGTKIGNNSVVGAGCVLKGEYPGNSVIFQRRNTEVEEIVHEIDK